jgi:ribosomal protein S8
MQYAYIIIHSNLSVIILGILEDRGGLISAKPDRIRGIMKMLVFFNYIGAAPVIRDIFLVSRPGRRVF